MEEKKSNKKRIRRRFVPFFEKLLKLRHPLGDVIINQIKIQNLLCGLILMRSINGGFYSRYTRQFIKKLTQTTLGELISIFKGYCYNRETDLVIKLEKFNKIRNLFIHKINFYEGPVAMYFGKKIPDFEKLKNDINEINHFSQEVIKVLEKKFSEDLKKFVEKHSVINKNDANKQ
jgi:hypothetical protein